MTDKPDTATFWRDIDEAARRVEHGLNLRGKTTVVCSACGGKGYSRPGYDDYDGYGPIWREPTPCETCRGGRALEVPCSSEVQAAAVEAEIERLSAERQS